MPTIHYILKDGSTRSLEAKAGASVMETAIHGNIRGIDAECGGCCSCATCHVFVDPAFNGLLPDMSDDENDLLDSSDHRDDRSRLSCQLTMTDELDGLTVTIAPED